jgi:hypothetical protein
MKTSVIAALGAGLISTLGMFAGPASAATELLDVSEQGSGISTSPTDDLATATSATTTSWGSSDTFTLLSPFSPSVTSFTLSNPVNLSVSGSANLGTNTLTVVIGGVTYTDTLTETANLFSGVEETGFLTGAGLPAGGLKSSLAISYTQTGGAGNGVSGSATFAVYSPVPEPSTWAMMMLGFAGLGYAAFRRASKDRASAVAV